MATRQTAGNNATLKAIRRRMNGPIYKMVMDAWNRDGEEQAFDVLSRYFNAESWPRIKAEFANPEGRA